MEKKLDKNEIINNVKRVLDVFDREGEVIIGAEVVTTKEQLLEKLKGVEGITSKDLKQLTKPLTKAKLNDKLTQQNAEISKLEKQTREQERKIYDLNQDLEYAEKTIERLQPNQEKLEEDLIQLQNTVEQLKFIIACVDIGCKQELCVRIEDLFNKSLLRTQYETILKVLEQHDLTHTPLYKNYSRTLTGATQQLKDILSNYKATNKGGEQ